MNVVLVSGEFPPDIGGTARLSALLSEELLKRHHSIYLVTLGEGQRTTKGSGTVRYPRRWPWPLRLTSVAWWLLWNRQRYDVVFAASLHPAAVVGARLARRPVVLYMPGDLAWERAVRLRLTNLSFEEFDRTRQGGTRVRAMRTLRNWSVRNATAVAVPSEYMGGFVNRWTDGSVPVVIIPPAAPPRRVPDTKRVDGASLRAVFVGRLIPVKRAGLLLEAIAKTEGVQLEVIGDGPERAALEARTVGLGLQDRVTFNGALDHDRVLDRLAAADVFVLPSEVETLSRAAVEALACGTPVLAARVGGMPEIVADGVNGVLLDDATPDSIAGVLAGLREDDRLRDRLSAGAHRSAASWEIDRCVGKIEGLLTQAVANSLDARKHSFD